MLKIPHHAVSLLHDRFQLSVPEYQPGESADRWVLLLAPEFHFTLVEGVVVVLGCRLQRIVLGRVALEDYAPASSAASCAAGHLRQKLKSSFRAAKIRQIQTNVRGNDADKSDERQVQPFGDHLRADEDVGLMAGKSIEDLFMAALAPRSVAVPTQEAGPRRDLAHDLFDSLRTRAEEADSVAVASRAALGDW